MGPRPRASGGVTDRNIITQEDFRSDIFDFTGTEIPIHRNIVVYGDSGTGKTHLAGTYPGDAFFICAEPGWHTARKAARGKHSGRMVRDAATAWAALEHLQATNYKYPCVVVDGASTLQSSICLHYCREAYDSSPEGRRSRAGRNLPDRPDYFNTQNFMLSWISELVAAPCDLIITAHPFTLTKTLDGIMRVMPGFHGRQGDIAQHISGLMDATLFMDIRTRKDGKTARCIWSTQPKPRSSDSDTPLYTVGSKFTMRDVYVDTDMQSLYSDMR